eukprot:6175-Hanusia_phi.AAC.2
MAARHTPTAPPTRDRFFRPLMLHVRSEDEPLSFMRAADMGSENTISLTGACSRGSGRAG